MIKLYEYQSDALNLISVSLKEVDSLLVVMPTGSGKTYTFWAYVQRMLQKDPFSKILFLFHKEELLAQALNTGHSFGLAADIIINRSTFTNILESKPQELRNKMHDFNNRKTDKRQYANCMLGMIKSVLNAKERGDLPKPFDLIVIDEAHIGDFRKVKEYFPNTKIIGFTATPVAASKKNPLKNDFQKMIDVVSNRQLVDMQKLIEPIHIIGNFAVEKGKMKKDIKGEYDEKEQILKFSMPAVETAFVENYKKYSAGRHSLVFCVNIKDCEYTAKLLGIPAFHSKNKAEHAQILADFRSGKTKSIATIGILATGFDFPPISAIFLKRVTTSLPLYLQMIGRATRICEGKTQAFVIDILNNQEEFGEWGDTRNWAAMFEDCEFRPKVAPSKRCPSCGAANPPSARNCKYCDAIFPIKPKEEVIAEYLGITVLKKIDPYTCTIPDLYEWIVLVGKNSNDAASYIRRRNVGDSVGLYRDLKKYAELSAQIKDTAKQGWVHVQINIAQNGGKK